MIAKNKDLELDKELINKLKEFNLQPVKILHRNYYKRSLTLLCETKNGEKRVVKFCEGSAPKKTIEEFKRERKFYETYSGFKIIPVPFCLKERFLVIEYIEGSRLRKWLENYIKNLKADKPEFEYKELIENMISGFENLYFSNNPYAKEERGSIFWFLKKFNDLAYSGPIDTSRAKFFELWSFLLKISCRPLSCFYFWFILRKAHRKKVPIYSSVFHGDLHYNNILVSRELKIKIIDFEISRFEGCWVVDLAYLTAMILAFFHDYPAHRQFYLSKILKMIEDRASSSARQFFLKVLRAFKIAVSLNSRFHYKLNNVRVIINHLLFPFRMMVLLLAELFSF